MPPRDAGEIGSLTVDELEDEFHVDADAFHAHLDACAQCREHPFGLCLTGATLLTQPEPAARGARDGREGTHVKGRRADG